MCGHGADQARGRNPLGCFRRIEFGFEPVGGLVFKRLKPVGFQTGQRQLQGVVVEFEGVPAQIVQMFVDLHQAAGRRGKTCICQTADKSWNVRHGSIPLASNLCNNAFLILLMGVTFIQSL